MPKLTKERHAKKAGEHCPECGRKTVQVSKALQVVRGGVRQEMNCYACKASWRDIYKLTGYRNLKHDRTN